MATAAEINIMNAALHSTLSAATEPQPLDDAIAIGEQLYNLPRDDWQDLDFPIREAKSHRQLYIDQNKNCMRWLLFTYDVARSEIRMKYEVI